MPVTRAALLLTPLVLVACNRGSERAKKVTPPVLARGTADASAAPAMNPAFLPPARAARDAATKVASGCQLHSDYGDDEMRYSDRCTFPPADVTALRAAQAALATAPVAGNREAVVFAEEVRLFTDWIELVKAKDPVGTLSHYQGLAAAWNALQPGERIAVDLRTKDPYDGTVVAPPDGGTIAWSRCSSGPCIVVPRKVR